MILQLIYNLVPLNLGNMFYMALFDLACEDLFHDSACGLSKRALNTLS